MGRNGARAREVLGGSRQQVVDAVDWMPGDPTQHRAPVGFGGEAVALGGADQGSIAAVRSRRVARPSGAKRKPVTPLRFAKTST